MLLEKQVLSKLNPHFSMRVVADLQASTGFFEPQVCIRTVSVRMPCVRRLHSTHACFLFLGMNGDDDGHKRFLFDL